MSSIRCNICDAEVHAIQTHLAKVHSAESTTPMTLEEYKESWPDAPLLSEKARLLLEQNRNKKSPENKGARKLEGEKMAMHDLFELGSAKAARNKRGEPLMIDVCQQNGYEDMIPDIDHDYVYNIENLKTIVMGLSMNIPTYVFGHAGTGKSSIIEGICSRTNRRMHRIQHTINLEESHIVGEKTIKKEVDEKTGEIVTSVHFDLGPLPIAMIHGHVYLADEYDRAPSSVLSVYQAVLEGKPLYIKEAPPEFRVIRPHPDFRFLATGNTNGSGDHSRLYNAAMVQDSATVERFGIILEQDYMPRANEEQIIRSKTRVPAEDAKILVNFAHRVREQYPARISKPISPRSLIYAAKVGLGRGCFVKGIELAFANQLPPEEKMAVLEIAQRLFSS